MGQAIGGVIPGCCACTRCDIQPDELHVGVKRRLRVGAVLGDHAGCRDEVDSDGLHAFIEQLHSGAIDERGERRLPPPLEAAMHFDDGAGGKRPEDADVCEYSDEDRGAARAPPKLRDDAAQGALRLQPRARHLVIWKRRRVSSGASTRGGRGACC